MLRVLDSALCVSGRASPIHVNRTVDHVDTRALLNYAIDLEIVSLLLPIVGQDVLQLNDFAILILLFCEVVEILVDLLGLLKEEVL